MSNLNLSIAENSSIVWDWIPFRVIIKIDFNEVGGGYEWEGLVGMDLKERC